MARRQAIDLTAADGLDNEKRARLLGVIDQLRELGISEDVSLPQVGSILFVRGTTLNETL
jgi:hypothetical protein